MRDELHDKADIQETILKYAWGIDSRDWVLYRSIFADEVYIDFSSFNGVAGATMPADQWVSNLKLMLPGFDATQHVLSNFMIDIEGELATAIVYMKAEHFLVNSGGDNTHTVGGYYTHKLKQTEDGWRIYSTTLTAKWTRGNRQVYKLAVKRVAASDKKK